MYLFFKTEMEGPPPKHLNPNEKLKYLQNTHPLPKLHPDSSIKITYLKFLSIFDICALILILHCLRISKSTRVIKPFYIK